MSSRQRRSYLFVPGNRPERFAKACAAGADAVIVDLEDAVPAAEKAAARASVTAWANPAQPVLVRINAAETEWFMEDLRLCAHPGVAGVVLPKAERGEDTAMLAQAGAAAVLPLIESAAGFAHARELAQAPKVQCLLFGSIDFQHELGIGGDYEELLYFRSHLVLVSRLAGIQAPVDGVTTAIDDGELLRSDAHYARRLGFGGKLCIHPKQVPVVNQAFLPSAQEVEWAQRVLSAADASQGAAVAVDGKMVDLPVILKARLIIEEAGRGLAA